MNTPISLDNLREICPAVFTETPHETVSSRYSFVPTIKVVEDFKKQGWEVFSANQRGSGGYGRHMLKLRHGDLKQVGDSIVECILTNGHDGTTQLSVSAGLHRLVCSNGLMLPISQIEEIKFRHKGITDGMISEVTNHFIEIIPSIHDGMKEMQTKILTLDEKVDFAEKAINLRWKDNKNVKNITTGQVLIPRREDDMGDDMWKVFNVVQEKLVRGGLIYKTTTGRNMTSKGLTEIVSNTKFNRELWELASSY